MIINDYYPLWLRLIFQSWGWGLELTHCCFQFLCFQQTSKEFKLLTANPGISEQTKLLYLDNDLVRQAAEIKFESKFEPLPIIWESLPTAIQTDNQGLTAKSMAELLGSTSAQLGLLWLASTNTGSFQVGSCSCWQLQASLRKSATILWYWLSLIVKMVSLLCRFRALTIHFFFLM